MEPELEAALFNRMRTGDARAFDEIYDAFNAKLLRYLLRMTKNRTSAEDLLEETWLRFVAGRAELAADTRLGPWLFTVARNLFFSYRRSRAREAAYTKDLVLLWPGALPPSPFETASSTQLEERLEAAIASLPATYREVILLVGVEQLRPMDAARICGISPEALRQRLSRARGMVSRFLAEDEDVTHDDLLRALARLPLPAPNKEQETHVRKRFPPIAGEKRVTRHRSCPCPLRLSRGGAAGGGAVRTGTVAGRSKAELLPQFLRSSAR